MKIARTIADVRRSRRGMAGSLALVPTMGALHAGHESLIRRAKELADHVGVSIFVNPTQFGPREDLSRYPRPIEKDLALCEGLGVDLVFNPEPVEIYPADELDLVVDVPALIGILEGAHRPGHFVGVCRVVAKLFNIFQPDIACFGMKDYQQLRVIEAMTRGLSLPVRIQPCPTVREADGLAMSSRNIYLEGEERSRALALAKALDEAEALIRDGETDPAAVESAMAQVLRAHRAEVDYAVVREPFTLQGLDIINPRLEPVVCLIAARIGRTRLIDNRLIEEPASEDPAGAVR